MKTCIILEATEIAIHTEWWECEYDTAPARAKFIENVNEQQFIQKVLYKPFRIVNGESENYFVIRDKRLHEIVETAINNLEVSWKQLYKREEKFNNMNFIKRLKFLFKGKI